MESFHNTIGLRSKDLLLAESNCINQEEHVLRFFNENKDKDFTPAEVHNSIFKNWSPITSTRRAITNLTSKGSLEKTENKRKGDYGMMNYAWKLK